MRTLLASRWRAGAAFYRIKDWPHLLGLILLGYAAAGERTHYGPLLAALIAGFFYLAHGYSINDIYDRQVRIAVDRKQALLLSLAPLVFCLIIAGLISPGALLAAALGHISGMFYSVRPFRFKNKVLFDLVFNGLSLTPLFLLGYAAAHTPDARAFGFFFLFFLYFIPVQLVHEIQDSAADQADLQSNTLQALGPQKTAALIRAASVLYALWALRLWETRSLGPVSFFLTVVFAAVLFFLDPAFKPWTRVKETVRYFSAGYGVFLWAALFLGV